MQTFWNIRPDCSGGRLTNLLNSATIRQWLHASATKHSLGLAPIDALAMAALAWKNLLEGVDPMRVVPTDGARWDVLHAVVHLLQADTDKASERRLMVVASLYRYVRDQCVTESAHVLDEKDVVCGGLAFEAWSTARRLNRFGEMQEWETICDAHLSAQSDVGAFLQLPSSEMSQSVVDRFFSNPATVVALFARQRSLKNRDPLESARLGYGVYRWMAEHQPSVDADDHAHIAGRSAFFVAAGLALAGRFVAVNYWTRVSKAWFARALHPEPWLAKVDLIEAIAWHNQHRPSEALARVPSLRETFVKCGMREELRRCWLLETAALKDLGFLDEALVQLDQMARDEDVRTEPLVLGLVLVNRAEVLATRGFVTAALKAFGEAVPILKSTNVPWAVGNAEAMLGQALRDRGELEAAIPLYRAAVDKHLDLQLEGRAAYFRVLLAEALLMSGREDEARAEILAALPAFEGESLVPAATAAIALLRESIRRQKADPEALRTLKLELQKMREGNQS